MKLKCLQCEHIFDGDISLDKLGWHSVCPECDGSFDVDIPDGKILEILKNDKEYDFECNMSKEYKAYTDHDEWGCAWVWLGDIGAEYNFCFDDGESYCAIYKMEMNHKTGYVKTDSDTFIHYDIDFDKDNWMEELENAMCEALIKFFDLQEE